MRTRVRISHEDLDVLHEKQFKYNSLKRLTEALLHMVMEYSDEEVEKVREELDFYLKRLEAAGAELEEVMSKIVWKYQDKLDNNVINYHIDFMTGVLTYCYDK